MRVFRFVIFLSIVCIGILYFQAKVIASEYVLPYPSFMPGNKVYTVMRIIDSFEKWWYWGNIAGFKYHLKLADKYLIEAKTLFEYKQYKLGMDALKRSDIQIPMMVISLQSAYREGKDIKQLQALAFDAMTAHVKVLERLLTELPSSFQWSPEKKQSVRLNLSDVLIESIALRKKSLNN